MLCARCKLDKSSDDFYKNNRSYCKRCMSSKASEWRLKNPERFQAIREKHKEKAKIRYKKWYKENGRGRNSLQQAAHYLVFMAIKEGVLTRPSTCAKCGRGKRIEAHHENYYKPLDVIWLCNRCHRKLHPGIPRK